MSEAHEILLDVIQDRAPGTTTPVTNERTGRVFPAEIEGNIDALIIASELGEDARELIIVHVTDPADACGINYGDTIQFRLFGQLTRHEIIKRRNNAGSPQADFWAFKLAPGKDT